MTPEQEQAFWLQNHQEPTQDVDPINEGLARTVNYMAKNWPTTPFRRGAAKVMTKAQYKEQMMNEAAGYPSNLDEAARVVALEQEIQRVDSKLDQILGALQVPAQSGYYQPVAPPPTPPARPVVVPSISGTPIPVQLSPQYPTCPPPGSQMVPMTVVTTPHASPPVSSIQPSPPQVFQETPVQTKPVPMSLGSVGAVEHEHGQLGKDEVLPLYDEDQELLEESFPNETVSVSAHLVEEVQEPIVDKQLERQQVLTDQVTEWLGQKDPHKFWRRFVGGSCNKNLSYNTWPKEFQGPFNERFTQMLGDPCFVSNICGRILKMQNGHMVGCHVAGAFVTVIAGFLSFSLIDV